MISHLKKRSLSSLPQPVSPKVPLVKNRNENCEARDTDVLDVLSVIQPITGDAVPVSRTELVRAAERLPRGGKIYNVPGERIRLLLEFLAGIRVCKDVVMAGDVRVMSVVRAAEVDKMALDQLLRDLFNEDGQVYWENFENVVGEREVC
jgi:hypothetical protein